MREFKKIRYVTFSLKPTYYTVTSKLKTILKITFSIESIHFFRNQIVNLTHVRTCSAVHWYKLIEMSRHISRRRNNPELRLTWATDFPTIFLALDFVQTGLCLWFLKIGREGLRSVTVDHRI